MYGEGEKTFKYVLAVSEERLRATHRNILDISAEFARVLLNPERFGQARAMYARNIQVQGDLTGGKDERVLNDMSFLALTLSRLNQPEEAKSMSQECLKLKEEVYGGEHKWTLTETNNLGTYLEELGDFEGAQAMYEQAVQGAQENLRSKDADLKVWQANLADLRETVQKDASSNKLWNDVCFLD